MTRDDFAERLAAPTPTPGGGAAAARVGLYACSLLRMVTGITLTKLDPAGLASTQPGPLGPGAGTEGAASIREAANEAARIGARFSQLEEEDMAAFQAYLDALRLPRATPEEKERRRLARQAAAARATDAPLAMLAAALDVLRLAQRLADLSRTTPLRAESDLGAAVELDHAVFRAAELNIRANFPELAPEKKAAVEEAWDRLAAEFLPLYTSLHGSRV